MRIERKERAGNACARSTVTTTIEKRRNHPAKTTLTANVHCTSFALAASSETRAARGMAASAWNRPERSSAALTGAKG